MSTRKRCDEDFKRTFVDLYHNGKTQASLIKEYSVSQTALTRWKDNGPCINHLNQLFNQSTPNSVWASDFTYA